MPATTTELERRTAARRPDAQAILSIRAAVPAADVQTFVADALHDVRLYMQEHDVLPAGPPFSICRPRGSTVDVEAGWPTGRLLAGTGRIHGGSLPQALTGPHDDPHASAELEPF